MRIIETAALTVLTLFSGAVAGSGTVASPLSRVQQPYVKKPTIAQKCKLPPGWDTVAARRPRFVIFGEIHGTQEAPDFVGELACALALQNKRILIAVEHSSTKNDALQKAWQLPIAQFPAALKQTVWTGRDDGRGSEAMLSMLVRLHHLAQHGKLIDIVAFNGAKDEEQARRFSHLPTQGPHEAAQAENIREAAALRPYDHVLVLVGNVHARKRPVERSGVAFEPMVMQLGPVAATISLNMEAAGGTSWSCQLKPGFKPEPNKPITSDAIVCGSYLFNGSADRQRAPFISLTSLQGVDLNEDYDGIFWLGRVSASPPAVPQDGQKLR